MIRRLAVFATILLPAIAASCAGRISDADATDALRRLDRALAARMSYIEHRQAVIDSLLADKAGPDYALIAETYSGFNNDSALAFTRRAESGASGTDLALAQLRSASLLPLAGVFEGAQKQLESVDKSALPDSLLPVYYESARQMYSYMSAFYERYPRLHDSLANEAMDMQRHLLKLLPPDSDEHLFNEGEYAMLTGNKSHARVALAELLMRPTLSHKLRARASHHLSAIARDEGDEAARTYYLAESAIADILAANREVASLQELGATLRAQGDIDRAYTYLTTALANAVDCGAEVRMLESARAMPAIEQAYSDKIAAYSRASKWAIAILVVFLIVLGVLLFMLRRDMQRMRLLQQNLLEANRTKEAYMSRFLSLCSLYMDKLKQFSKLVARKISAGQVDDLYRMARSGKFVEEQSGDFYGVFDDAFLRIYPGFINEVNALLQPDARIEMPEGKGLNTDLRILAFMRLGVEDTATIAQILNYSVNTIYSYRNRLRSRAINRDTFEADIQRIGQPNT